MKFTSRFGTPLKATISHSEIEKLFLLSGDLHVEGQIMHAGDYCRADSGMIHVETFTESGCLFLLLASQQNELLSKQGFFDLQSKVLATARARSTLKDHLSKHQKPSPLIGARRT